jgi:hypothetical protein
MAKKNILHTLAKKESAYLRKVKADVKKPKSKVKLSRFKVKRASKAARKIWRKLI